MCPMLREGASVLDADVVLIKNYLIVETPFPPTHKYKT